MASAYNRRGCAIHLAKLRDDVEDGSIRFSLNKELAHEMKDMERLMRTKVVIISVAGAFRKGKSFLLNFFLRFLKALENRNTDNWIQNDACHEDGFHWRSGSKRDTTGIIVWSQPFFITKPNGEEVAVLLMDTQGTFDHQSTQHDCTTIFALSTLLSSVQIFNISQNIQETDLQHLRLFVEFAAMAKSTNGPVLQHLWFLVRDWQYPDEHQYGVNGGKEYLDTVLACGDDKPKENQELRQGIQRHFEKSSCCLLPHPGSAVASSQFRGEVQKLDSEFVCQIEQFVRQVLTPQSIIVKKINGKELTGKEFIDFLEVYFEAFCSETMPTPKSVYAATVEMANISASTKAKQLFEEKMQEFDDPKLSDSDFTAALDQAAEQALDFFNSNCMEKDSSDARKSNQKLKDDLQQLRRNHISHRQLRSEKITAEERSELMKKERDFLNQQNIDRQKKMKQMEAESARRLEEIRKLSISNDEKERMLREEAMQRAIQRREVESKNEELTKQVQQLMELHTAQAKSNERMLQEMNSLHNQMQDATSEANRKKRGLCLLM